jgi:hypothetical protein
MLNKQNNITKNQFSNSSTPIATVKTVSLYPLQALLFKSVSKKETVKLWNL